MFENLLEHILALSPEALPTASLENMALCAVWYDSYREQPEKQTSYAAIRQLLDVWVRTAYVEETDSKGARQQPLLRLLIEDVEQGKLDDFSRDELDFLYFAWGLLLRCTNQAAFARPMEKLRPHLPEIQKRRELFDIEPGLPSLAKRVRIVTTNDIRKAASKEVDPFAGIDLGYQGPTFFSTGLTKVLGDLPDGCAVVVDEGDCAVAGRVLGNLAASDSCDVLAAISGAVIAQRGDIRGGKALNASTIISKEGSIHLQAAETPRMIYAYRQVAIDEDMISGTLLGHDVKVVGTLTGGRIQITGTMEAAHFSITEQRSLAIVLRRSLSCQDYGEVLHAEARRMLASVTAFRQRLNNLERITEITEREADEYAGNTLLFLLGEDNSSERMQRIQKLRRRIAFIDRLSEGAQSLVQVLEEYLGAEEDNERSLHDARTLLEELERELMLLAAEGTIDRDLYNERETVLSMGYTLLRKTLTRKESFDTLQSLLKNSEMLQEKRKQIEEMVEQQEAFLQKLLGRAAILERARAKRSRPEVLQQLVKASRERTTPEPLRRRFNDRYVKLMQRNIENRLSRVAGYKVSRLELESRIHQLRKKLWEEHRVSLPENTPGQNTRQRACVRGSFDEGVRICAWSYLLDESSLVNDAMLITPDSEEQCVCYQRTPMGTIEPC